jgi:hypothetical protein
MSVRPSRRSLRALLRMTMFFATQKERLILRSAVRRVSKDAKEPAFRRYFAASRRIRPATARTLPGAARQIAAAETMLNPMQIQNTGV